MPKVPVSATAIEAAAYAGREGERFLTSPISTPAIPRCAASNNFAGVKFYQAIHVTPSKSRVLARLNDQTPLVLEQQIGEGKVLIFTSTFDNVVERSSSACLLGAVRGADPPPTWAAAGGAASEPDGRFLRRTAHGG